MWEMTDPLTKLREMYPGVMETFCWLNGKREKEREIVSVWHVKEQRSMLWYKSRTVFNGNAWHGV